ncbi:hypothetical protein KM043_002697 [Ampulex compressa]|nr:hypothetical protein KM043_002697 [Ampulex compressa]
MRCLEPEQRAAPRWVGKHAGETSERVVLFGNGNIVVTREDIVHLTTEPRHGRESLLVHVMPNTGSAFRFTCSRLPVRGTKNGMEARRGFENRREADGKWYNKNKRYSPWWCASADA